MRLAPALLVVALLLALPAAALAADRYASPTGRGTACSSGSRCTVVEAISGAAPGDTINLRAGTLASPLVYHGASAMITPPPGKSGTAASPITIRCEVAGGCLLDGEFVRVPMRLTSNSFIVIEDINARHGYYAVFEAVGASDGYVLRRSVLWDSRIDWNGEVCAPRQKRGAGLFEDVACFGVGRKTVTNSQAGPDTSFTCRRCWARWEGSINMGPKMTYSMQYNSKNFTCENCIGMWSGESMPETYTLHNNGVVATPAVTSEAGTYQNFTVSRRQAWGILGMDNVLSTTDRCIGVSILGSLALYRHTDRQHQLIAGVRQAADAGCITLRHVYSYVEPAIRAFWLGGTSQPHAIGQNLTGVRPATLGDVLGVGWALTNNAFGTTVDSVPGPWSATTAGANLCHRWINGQVTTQPLWPWPMNDRIKAATAMAWSYSGPCPSCVGGRSARTEMDLTAAVESKLGTIPSECRTDTTDRSARDDKKP